MAAARLVPELYCSDFDRSLRFYVDILGFRVRYRRPEDRFAYLEREGAEIMIEAPGDPRRTWLAGELARPLGRGVNFQIEVGDVDALLARVQAAGVALFQPIEERWYRKNDQEVGNRQFLVQDPDGYLLRFFQDLGCRDVGGRGHR
jgi:catechol 2,3-dioxygenase-like lactoylglutathione lyase family enzyme